MVVDTQRAECDGTRCCEIERTDNPGQTVLEPGVRTPDC